MFSGQFLEVLTVHSLIKNNASIYSSYSYIFPLFLPCFSPGSFWLFHDVLGCNRNLQERFRWLCENRHMLSSQNCLLLLFILFCLAKRLYACFSKLANTLIVPVTIADRLKQVCPRLVLLTVWDFEASIPLALLLSKRI